MTRKLLKTKTYKRCHKEHMALLKAKSRAGQNCRMLSNIRQFDPRTKRNYRIFEEHSIIPLLKYAKDPDRHQIPIRVFQVGLSRTVLLTNSAYILGIEAEQEAVTRHIQLHLIDNGGFHCKSDLGGDQVHDDVFAVVEFDPEHFSAFIRKSASPVEKGAAACASRSRWAWGMR